MQEDNLIACVPDNKAIFATFAEDITIRNNQIDGWNLTLERTFGVSVPKRGLIEVAPSEFGNHGVLISNADEALKRTMIQYSSYFAKLNTKGEVGKRVREFGCSLL